MKKGDIWLVQYPYKGRREQAGVRPAIVMTDASVGIILAIPLTSNALASRFPFTCTIEPSQENGLNKTSVALVFQLQALDRSRFKKILGKVSGSTIIYLNTLIKKLLQL